MHRERPADLLWAHEERLDGVVSRLLQLLHVRRADAQVSELLHQLERALQVALARLRLSEETGGEAHRIEEHACLHCKVLLDGGVLLGDFSDGSHGV